MATYIILAIISYLIGSISFSIILSKKMAGFDIREKGSGNAGTTNMLRSVGKKAAALTLLGDALKGVLAVLLAVIIGNIVKDVDKALLVQVSGIFVVIGHTFPIFFKFKGGKGVATALGVLLIINWQVGLICLVFALVIMALTKMVSIGSVGTAVLLPILILFIELGVFNGTKFIAEGSNYFIFSLILALIVAYNHRSNIKRIMNGTENKMSLKK